MTFARAVFAFAFLMLIVGAVGARLVIGPLLFGDVNGPSYAVSARVSTATISPASATPRPVPTWRVAVAPSATPIATPTARPTATNTIVTRTKTPVATPSPTSHPAVHSTGVVRPRVHAAKVKRAATGQTATPRPTATAQATPSPTPSGIVTLTNYWVGSATSRPGSTIAVGYVINNGTGATAHIELGASVKSSSQLSWARDSISDPGHDVVAVVPPGISQHVRYFTLSSGLKAGAYDIAWGLRNPSTGDRVALVAAANALHVQGVIPAP